MPPVATPPVAVSPPLYAPGRAARYETTGRAVFAAVVLLVFGAVEALGGALGAVFAAGIRRAFDQALRGAGIRIEANALPTVVAATFVVVLLVGVLHIAAAAGILSHRSWARALGVLLCAAGLALGAVLLYRTLDVRGMRLPTVVGELGLLVPYAVTLLALLFPGDHFRPRRVYR